MARTRWMALASVALGLASVLACTPRPCDDVRLRAAATEAARLDRAAYVDALLVACPKMPAGLADTLRVSTGRLSPAQLVQVFERRDADPQWKQLSERTCPPTDGPPPDATRARAQRLRCNLDRYEMLEPEDPYVWGDFPGFVLFEWLRGVGTDEALARDVVMPLLAKGATEEKLEAMCLAGDGACEIVLARWGIDPPTSTADGELVDAMQIEITTTQLRANGNPVLGLSHGRAPEREQRAIDELHTVIAEVAARDHDEPPTIQWRVDGEVPFRTFVDAAFSAHKAGIIDGAVLVQHDGRVATLPVSWSRAWAPPDDVERDSRVPRLRFVLHADAVEVIGPDRDAPPQTFALPCGPGSSCATALAGLVKTHHEQWPHDTVASVAADDDASVADLVALLDAVRGEGCRLPRSSIAEDAPSECHLWQPILDAVPALYFHVDRRGRFVVGDPSVRSTRRNVEVSDRRVTRLVEAATAARETIATCVADSPDILSELDGTRDELSVMLGPSDANPKRTAARVFLHDFVGGPAQDCVLKALGIQADTRRATDFIVAAEVELTLPLQLDPEG